VGSRRREAGEETAARESLTRARDEAANIGAAEEETIARCQLACLARGDAGDALAAFAANEERLGAEERRAARFLLFTATGDRTHLVEAKRLLDEAVSSVPDDVRESMLANVRLHREIAAAAREHGVA